MAEIFKYIKLAAFFIQKHIQKVLILSAQLLALSFVGYAAIFYIPRIFIFNQGLRTVPFDLTVNLVLWSIFIIYMIWILAITTVIIAKSVLKNKPLKLNLFSHFTSLETHRVFTFMLVTFTSLSLIFIGSNVLFLWAFGAQHIDLMYLALGALLLYVYARFMVAIIGVSAGDLTTMLSAWKFSKPYAFHILGVVLPCLAFSYVIFRLILLALLGVFMLPHALKVLLFITVLAIAFLVLAPLNLLPFAAVSLVYKDMKKTKPGI
jgi:hypothetical protein